VTIFSSKETSHKTIVFVVRDDREEEEETVHGTNIYGASPLCLPLS
jgi:hypothetical protein